jgi:hypothetical protein
MRTIIIIYLLCAASCYAQTVTFGSFPENDTQFYYSDGHGNSISFGTTRSVPYIYNNYPTGIWVDAATHRIPANLVVYQYINGYPGYLCRVGQSGKWFYGWLVINQGCVLQEDEKQVFSSFQVLVR